MTPTHRLKGSSEEKHKARCWQFVRSSGFPIWVARNFHDLGGGVLTHQTGQIVHEWDWIVNTPGKFMVLTPAEFESSMEAISS